RVAAAEQNELQSIECEIRTGGYIDALKYSLGANAGYGLRRTNADKRHAVELALKELRGYSNVAIAELCCVSDPFVGKVKAGLEQDQVLTVRTSESDRVTGKDGKSYPATKPRLESDDELEESASRDTRTASKPKTPKSGTEIVPTKRVKAALAALGALQRE